MTYKTILAALLLTGCAVASERGVSCTTVCDTDTYQQTVCTVTLTKTPSYTMTEIGSGATSVRVITKGEYDRVLARYGKELTDRMERIERVGKCKDAAARDNKGNELLMEYAMAECDAKEIK